MSEKEKITREYRVFIEDVRRKGYFSADEKAKMREFCKRATEIKEEKIMKTTFMNSFTGDINEIVACLPVDNSGNWFNFEGEDAKYKSVWVEMSKMFWNDTDEKYYTFALAYDVKFPCMDMADDNKTCVVVRKFDKYGHYLAAENEMIIGRKGKGLGCEVIPHNEETAKLLMNEAIISKNIYAFSSVSFRNVSASERYLVCNSEYLCNDMDEDIEL